MKFRRPEVFHTACYLSVIKEFSKFSGAEKNGRIINRLVNNVLAVGFAVYSENPIRRTLIYQGEMLEFLRCKMQLKRGTVSF